MVEKKEKEGKQDKLLIIVFGLFALIVVLSVITLLVMKTPESYGEIWLNNYPQEINLKQEFETSFSIKNSMLEDNDFVYSFKTRDEKLTENKTVRVEQGKTLTISETMVLKEKCSDCEKEKIELMVSWLENGKEMNSILWFWVTVV
ncbi:MAG: hypothetical protein ABH821_03095 [archaeon]